MSNDPRERIITIAVVSFGILWLVMVLGILVGVIQ
jgi:hypothetical protein